MKTISSEKICCVCLSVGLNFNKSLQKDENNLTLLTKLRSCIWEVKWIPLFHLCPECTRVLNITYTFREQCLKSDLTRKKQGGIVFKDRVDSLTGSGSKSGSEMKSLSMAPGNKVDTSWKSEYLDVSSRRELLNELGSEDSKPLSYQIKIKTRKLKNGKTVKHKNGSNTSFRHTDKQLRQKTSSGSNTKMQLEEIPTEDVPKIHSSDGCIGYKKNTVFLEDKLQPSNCDNILTSLLEKNDQATEQSNETNICCIKVEDVPLQSNEVPSVMMADVLEGVLEREIQAFSSKDNNHIQEFRFANFSPLAKSQMIDAFLNNPHQIEDDENNSNTSENVQEQNQIDDRPIIDPPIITIRKSAAATTSSGQCATKDNFQIPGTSVKKMKIKTHDNKVEEAYKFMSRVKEKKKEKMITIYEENVTSRRPYVNHSHREVFRKIKINVNNLMLFVKYIHIFGDILGHNIIQINS